MLVQRTLEIRVPPPSLRVESHEDGVAASSVLYRLQVLMVAHVVAARRHLAVAVVGGVIFLETRRDDWRDSPHDVFEEIRWVGTQTHGFVDDLRAAFFAVLLIDVLVAFFNRFQGLLPLKIADPPGYGVFFPRPERAGEVIVPHLVVTIAEINNPTRSIQPLRSAEEEAESITLYLAPLDIPCAPESSETLACLEMPFWKKKLWFTVGL